MPLPHRQPDSRLTWYATAGILLMLALLAVGLPLAATAFNRSNAVAYSCLNHLASELGFPFASPVTWLFDVSLTLAGILVLPALHAVQRRLATPAARSASACGYIAFLALTALGLYGLRQDLTRTPCIPAHFLIIHTALTLVFFLGWLIATALFTRAFLRHTRHRATKLMATLSLLCCLVGPVTLLVSAFNHRTEAALFNDLRHPAFRAQLQIPTIAPTLVQWFDTHRPHLWPTALLEWCVIWSSMLWFAASILFLWTNNRPRHPAQKSAPMRVPSPHAPRPLLKWEFKKHLSAPSRKQPARCLIT